MNRESIKAICNVLFAIVFTPIRWVWDALFRARHCLLEWRFVYGASLVNIRTTMAFADHRLLVVGYILFLARYFYICDDRQVTVVRDLLRDAIRNSQQPREITERLYETAVGTLNSLERNVVGKLFRLDPPLTFSEDEQPRSPGAKYAFLVSGRGGVVRSTFHMSGGADMILLPLTVGVLYEYVVSKIRTADQKAKLDQSIVDLLEAHKAVDCRSRKGLSTLPCEIIEKNSIMT